MNYSNFFENFYLPNTKGGLKGYKTQNNIPKFFLKYALDDDHFAEIDPSDSTYLKWLKGDRNPKENVWSTLRDHFDGDKLLKALRDNLNPETLCEVMRKFGIHLSKGEDPDKFRFAVAIKEQFKAIVVGHGDSDDIVREVYKKTEPTSYGAYFKSAVQKFKWGHLPGNGEFLMKDFFVCNNIGTYSAVFPYRLPGNYIKDATLEKIRTFDDRGELQRILLIGGCGYGKTLMLQHLFIESAEHYNETGFFPVFAELRNFSSRYDDFVSYIADTVKEYSPEIPENAVRYILEKGKAEILLDGLDNLSPNEVIHFQRKLDGFCQQYSGNTIIIASRPCLAVNVIRRFEKLYLHPLDEEQAKELIDKLLKDEQNNVPSFLDLSKVQAKAVKTPAPVPTDGQAIEQVDRMLIQKRNEEIIAAAKSFLGPENGYVEKNGFVVTNPMLLTIMVKNCAKIDGFNGDRANFYELMYNALIQHHAENPAFARSFQSVADIAEFTNAFREFCAIAFLDGVFEFDHRSFENCFKRLKCKDSLKDPTTFRSQAFQHDVCTTTSMMYEQESVICFIDPGFQGYFFAEYYYLDAELAKEMGRVLWDTRPDAFRILDGLRMLYRMAKEKTEAYVILPFLEHIFADRTDNEAFIQYLLQGYGTITYTALIEPVIQHYTKELGTAKLVTDPDTNNLRNAIMALVFDILGLSDTFVIKMSKSSVEEGENAAYFFTGYPASDSPNGSGATELRMMKHDISYKKDGDYFEDFYEPGSVLDDSGKTVCFGYVYNVELSSFLSEPDQLQLLLGKAKGADIHRTFIRVKDYYKQISNRRKNSAHR